MNAFRSISGPAVVCLLAVTACREMPKPGIPVPGANRVEATWMPTDHAERTLCGLSKASCDDGVACTVDTFDCDEGYLCADGTCARGKCHHARYSSKCKDGNVCTDNICTYKGCIHPPRTYGWTSCGPSGPCSSSYCERDTCRTEQKEGPCYDQPGYTANCIAGHCKNGQCTAAGPAPDGTFCSDGDVCTVQDRCKDAACIGKPRTCNDYVACTVDFCAQKTDVDKGTWSGCNYKGDDSACTDDGVVCTETKCLAWHGCKHIKMTCDDGAPCTVDTCVDDVCKHAMNGAACDDGIACTLDWCVTKYDKKPGEKTGCNHERNHATCNDGNGCTADKCDVDVGCLNLPAHLTCTDDDACTDDSCHPAKGCVFTKDPDCSG